jgi:RNA polymerase sigma factor (sigma-70 family)
VAQQNIAQLVKGFRDGDTLAGEALVTAVYDRLLKLSRKMLRSGSRAVQRWEQTEDLAHAAWFRIQRALENDAVQVHDDAHFFRLAARHVRFELIDLYRKHSGAHGLDANHHTVPRSAEHGQAIADEERFAANRSGEPRRLAAWAEFHQLVEQLPDKEREVVDLLWYQGLKQEEAAELLGVDVKTVKRRWREVKLKLSELLDPGLIEL